MFWMSFDVRNMEARKMKTQIRHSEVAIKKVAGHIINTPTDLFCTFVVLILDRAETGENCCFS